jgi:hypothetical protein
MPPYVSGSIPPCTCLQNVKEGAMRRPDGILEIMLATTRFLAWLWLLGLL